MAEKIIEVPAGKNIGQAMKDILRDEAIEKQRMQQRDHAGGKIANVLAAFLTEFAFDPDHAVEIALGYACALSLATETPKERFLAGLDKIWASQEKALEGQRKRQGAQMLAMAMSSMQHKQAVPPPVLQQLQVLKVELPPELQAWIDEGKNGAAHPTEVPVDEAKAAADKPN